MSHIDQYDLGSALMSGVAPSAEPPATGWTAPSLIYDNMRLVNASAIATDLDIMMHAKSEGLKAAWKTWYASWKEFFKKHEGFYQRLGNAFHTDELAAQVEQWRRSLGSLQATYAAESGVPNLTNPVPGTFEKPPEDKKSFSIPWWGWTLGGVLLVGAGWMVYRQVKELQAKREALEKNVLPLVLGSQLGPQLGPAMAQAATARDATPNMVYIAHPGVTYGP